MATAFTARAALHRRGLLVRTGCAWLWRHPIVGSDVMLDRRRLLVAGSSACAVPLLWSRAATSAEFSDGYAMGDGVRLHFVRSGDGPLMLFLHGHPDSSSLYERQMRE